MAQKTLLMILDGWGNSPDPTISAVDQARTPYIDSLYENYANSTLRTDGEHVGLPEGQMGNSEVGHMNLGAGRIVYQDLAKINLAVQKNELRNEKVLTDSFEYAKKEGKKVHLLGLLSDGGVHSHINHIKALKAKLKLFDNIPFFSVIVFFGDCEFKKIDYVPRDTYIVKAHRIFEALDKIANENNLFIFP